MEARERSGEATRERRKREGERCEELKMERKWEREEKRSKEMNGSAVLLATDLLPAEAVGVQQSGRPQGKMCF